MTPRSTRSESKNPDELRDDAVAIFTYDAGHVATFSAKSCVIHSEIGGCGSCVPPTARHDIP
jgi:hypothetical protein